MHKHLVLAVLAGLFLTIGHMQHRFVIIDGYAYTIVGQHEYMSYVRTGSCLRHDAKTYPAQRLVIHRCYV